MNINRRHTLTALAAVMGSAVAPSWAQPAAPRSDKPITIVVPYAAGGTTDILGRMLAQEMGPRLQRTIIVDNRPGAGSGIGASFVARSPADGNTLLVATSTTLAINPSLYQKLSYDPAKDFAPIGLIGAVPLLVVVHSSVQAKNIQELIALSKATPGGLSYGSAGNGSPQHLAVEMFKARTGANLTHVPYRGSGPALADLLGGQIQVMFTDIPPALQHVRGGRLRALAVTSLKRQPALAEVPAIAEAGAPGTERFEAVAWQSLVAPAGTPPELVQRYNEVMVQVMAQPALRQRLEADGFEPSRGITPQQLSSYIHTETERWGAVIRAAGAKID